MSSTIHEKNFDQHLKQFLARELKSGVLKKAPARLAESIRYSLLAPGKRIRPRLLLATAELLRVPERLSLPAASALEMIHCFSLIHDDLPCMDNDDFRRGRPSNHRQFDEATALLAGDALALLAAKVMINAARSGTDHKRVNLAVLRLLQATGPCGMIGGQALEFDPAYTSKMRLPQLEALFAGKTGALFLAAFEIPCELAGKKVSSKETQILTAFGRTLGFAFQVADDLDDQSDKKSDPVTITLIEIGQSVMKTLVIKP